MIDHPLRVAAAFIVFGILFLAGVGAVTWWVAG